ncbi:MAG: hypothetical protein ACREQL_02090, partial [Candidatus Binatia bacterium]
MSLHDRGDDVRLDSGPPASGILDGSGFRRRAWLAGALVLLMLIAVRLIMSELSANRREEAIATDVERLVASVE